MKQGEEKKGTRVISLCAIVIAASAFTMAVENTYGWTNVKPIARNVLDTGKGWGLALLGVEQKAAAQSKTAKLSRGKKTSRKN